MANNGKEGFVLHCPVELTINPVEIHSPEFEEMWATPGAQALWLGYSQFDAASSHPHFDPMSTVFYKQCLQVTERILHSGHREATRPVMMIFAGCHVPYTEDFIAEILPYIWGEKQVDYAVLVAD